MAAVGVKENNTRQEIETFIKEYNLQNIGSALMDEQIKMSDLCKQNDQKIDEFIKNVTEKVDDQEKLQS